MIRLLIYLVLVSALAFAAYWLANSGGTVAIDWLGYSVSLKVGIAIALLLVLIGVCILLFEAWRYLVRLPTRVSRHRSHNRTVKGYEELTAGLIAAAAGDAAHARQRSRRAEKLLQSNPATLLLTAQTAQLEGKEDLAQLKFQQMLKRPETEFLGLRGLLAEAIKRGDTEEALELARKAQQRSTNTPWVLTTLFDLLTRDERWEEAYNVVGDLARLKILRDTEVHRRRGLLRHMMAEQAAAKGRRDDALVHANKAAKLLPAFVPAAVVGARIAREQGNASAARKAIERAWRLEPHPELAQAYAEIEPEEAPAARLGRFARLENLNPRHKVTQTVMGELAIAAGRFDEARRHLDEALKLEPSAGVYRLYADLERASGGGEGKARDWLARAADASADRAWVCEDTGEMLPHWQIFGPSGRFDAVHWDYPPRVAHLAGDYRLGLTLTHAPAPEPTQTLASAARKPEAAPSTRSPQQAAPASKPNPVPSPAERSAKTPPPSADGATSRLSPPDDDGVAVYDVAPSRTPSQAAEAEGAKPTKRAVLQPAQSALDAAEAAARRNGSASRIEGGPVAAPPHGPTTSDGAALPDSTALRDPGEARSVQIQRLPAGQLAGDPTVDGAGKPRLAEANLGAVAKPLPRG